MAKEGGQPDNKNAEKWTKEEINKFIESVYDYAIANVDCCSLGEAITECGQYESLLRYFKEKNVKGVDFAPIKRVKDIIKQRIIKRGLENDYNATMSIFMLKAAHGMRDRPEDEEEKDIKITLEFGGAVDMNDYKDDSKE